MRLILLLAAMTLLAACNDKKSGMEDLINPSITIDMIRADDMYLEYARLHKEKTMLIASGTADLEAVFRHRGVAPTLSEKPLDEYCNLTGIDLDEASSHYVRLDCALERTWYKLLARYPVIESWESEVIASLEVPDVRHLITGDDLQFIIDSRKNLKDEH